MEPDIKILLIAKQLEDDTRADFAYRGDGEHIPGINIGKTK